LAFHRQKNFKEAIQSYQRALGLNPEGAEVHETLGKAYLELGKVDLALRRYRNALRINPRDIELRFKVAEILASQDRYDESIEDYEAVLRGASVLPEGNRD